MNDTSRLDAIGDFGLLLRRDDWRNDDGVWIEKWFCERDGITYNGATIREAIDAATEKRAIQ